MPDPHLDGKLGISQEKDREEAGAGRQRWWSGAASSSTLCPKDRTSVVDTAAQGFNMDGKFLPEGEEIQ